MKLGLIAGYSGKENQHSDRHDQTRRKPRLRLGVDVGSLRLRCRDAGRLDSRATRRKIKVGTAIMQMPARTPAHGRHDGDDVVAAFRQPLHCRPRRVRPAGGRRLARRAVRQAGDAPEGIHPDHEADLRARRSAAASTARNIRFPITARVPPDLGKPLKSIMVCEDKIPIYAATLTPAGVQAAAEVADGFFPIWMDPDQYQRVQGSDREGL